MADQIVFHKYRRYIFVAGSIYFVWWFLVQLILPGSFNPFISRAIVVAVIYLFGAAAFFSSWALQRSRFFFVLSAWLITLHYFYLFYENNGDTNWIVGAFITIVAINFCLLSQRELLSYSSFVLILSSLLFFALPSMKHSVYFPGLATILIQAHLGLSFRIKITRSLADTQENLRMRDEFISIASHELKTPLSALRLQTQIVQRELKKEILSPQKIGAATELYNRQIKRLTELVEIMLDVSKIAMGQLTLHPVSLDLVALVKNTIDSLKLLYPHEKVAIEFCEDGEMRVWADPHRIEEVVLNLLTNAIKYGRGNPIQVAVRKEGKEVVLTVEDRGMGISKEFLPRVFDRFERGVSVENYAGMGLGLYISREIVRAHHGQISVRSQENVGSTFTVRLASESRGAG